MCVDKKQFPINRSCGLNGRQRRNVLDQVTMSDNPPTYSVHQHEQSKKANKLWEGKRGEYPLIALVLCTFNTAPPLHVLASGILHRRNFSIFICKVFVYRRSQEKHTKLENVTNAMQAPGKIIRTKHTRW